MVRRVERLLSFCFALLFVCAAPSYAADSLVGIWYGKGQPDDPNVIFLDDFHADGTYVSEFRRYDGCKVIWDDVEKGNWTLKDKQVDMITTDINGFAVYYDTLYTLESLSATEQRTLHLETGYLFIETRVKKFTFPDCFVGS